MMWVKYYPASSFPLTLRQLIFSLNTRQHLITYCALDEHFLTKTLLSTREIKKQVQSLQTQNLIRNYTESDDEGRKYDDQKNYGKNNYGLQLAHRDGTRLFLGLH